LVEKEGVDEMTLADEPYFLKDKSWYYFDEKDCKYFLTDKAPEKARESYREYYSMIEDVEKHQ